jgi:hypothetical protein
MIVTLTSQGAFTGQITLSTSTLPTGVTGGFVPNPVSVAAGATNTSNLTISVLSTVPTGTVFTFNVTGTSSGLSHTTGLITVTVGVQQQPFFAEDDLHFIHHLSLSKHPAGQTYTANVTNPVSIDVSVLVHIVGTSQVDPFLSFDIWCGTVCASSPSAANAVTIPAGTNLAFSFTQPPDQLFANNRYSWTATLFWGTVGTTPSTDSGSTASGSFRVVA